MDGISYRYSVLNKSMIDIDKIGTTRCIDIMN